MQKLFYTTKPRSIILIGSIVLSTIIVWLLALWGAMSYSFLLSFVALAYGLGLRHAVDIDHIAAIDTVTRKLLHEGKKPISVGFYFSLGHVSVVVLISVITLFSASFITKHLPFVTSIGSVIGPSISGLFLVIIGMLNLLLFYDIFRLWRNKRQEKNKRIFSLDHQKGFFIRLLLPLIKKVTKSSDMYRVGFLFGLGFDTASQIGLLSLSALTLANGIPVLWLLLLPLSFAAGMILLDTLDGIMMLGVYGWAYINPLRKLFYNMMITLLSSMIALSIGAFELISVLSGQVTFASNFFQWTEQIDMESWGYLTIIIFICLWFCSAVFYKMRRYDNHI